MPRGNHTYRYNDFKSDLSGELLTFPKIKNPVKIGEKLGCGAYGDVFRGYIVNDYRESFDKRNTHVENVKSPSLRSLMNNETTSNMSSVNLKHLDTVTIYNNTDLTECIDTTFNSSGNEELRDNRHIDERTDFAIKYFKDDTIQILDEGFTAGTIRELSIMKSVGEHPNIVKLVDVYVGKHGGITNKLNTQIGNLMKDESKFSEKEFYFYPFKESQTYALGLYEFCKGISGTILRDLGGDLGRAIYKRMSKGNTGFTLDEVKWLSFQLLNGLAYLHNKKIEHRDLKPNNIMLDRHEPYPVLKIGDWGLGREFRSLDGTITPTACTMFYRPIEVILGSICFMNNGSSKSTPKFSHHYGINVDVWSAACIIAEMVTGKPLFHGNSDFQVLSRIVTMLGRPTEEEWKNCSRAEHYPFNGSLYHFSTENKIENLRTALKGKMDDLGLDLLLKMLEYNPHKRISAQAALSHEWFADVDFRRLDSLGVVNCMTETLKGLLGEEVFDIIEMGSKGMLTTTLLSHVLHSNSPIKAKIIETIGRDHREACSAKHRFVKPSIIRRVRIRNRDRKASPYAKIRLDRVGKE
ncbi:cell-cycle-related serine/threonine protein kinase [Theileria orientalis strain Shintoku]|uniref:Cyclin-dependent kinase 2 homolog n=1 Tax=Theileria orientalis strain Shintoku TaxID=869250 RepID=J4C487_THEOR|nr:cell-cycle-related serine/threonine protein kinase [Theileria orientalis strain Shintoku]BAM41756.1 cell-cycle-related serine/threonine protein kinase [Theileria orientalis strain Shintoku]|eukprot:XP_009692057.1 cell-cycle-related serine/threonine protein kinase [Theileria orientalis strain Shintoku]